MVTMKDNFEFGIKVRLFDVWKILLQISESGANRLLHE